MYENGTEAITDSTTKTMLIGMFDCQQLPDMSTSEISAFWVLVAISSISSLLSIILNASVIIAFKKRRELQRLSNILLSSIAHADLLTGVIFIPTAITVSLLTSRQGSLEHLCLTKTVIVNFATCFVFCSLYHLTMVAWERYVAIQKWMDYKVIVTRRRLKKLAIFAWLSAIFATLPVFIMAMVGVDVKVQKIWIMILNIFGAVNVVLIVYFYVMVYLGVRKCRSSEIRQLTAVVQAKLESKIAKMTGLITAALILTIVLSVSLLSLRLGFQAFRSNLLIHISGALLQLNAFLNPLLYCYKDRRFRNAIYELLRIRKRHAVKPTDDAVQFCRQKDQFGSLENVHWEGQGKLKNARKRTSRLTRSTSLHGTRIFDDVIVLKRSMSAPLPTVNSSVFDGLQLQQSCSFVITATIHAERKERHQQQKINCASSTKYMKLPECSVHLVRKRPRSKSWDAYDSQKISNVHLSKERKMKIATGRPKSAPCFFVSGAVAPEELLIPSEFASKI